MANQNLPTTSPASGQASGGAPGQSSRLAARLRAVLGFVKSGGWPAVLSCAAILLAVLHAVKPEFTVDGTTIGLLLVALLPWFRDVLKSVEIGGAKVTFKDVKAVTDTVRDAVECGDGARRMQPRRSEGRGLILGKGFGFEADEKTRGIVDRMGAGEWRIQEPQSGASTATKGGELRSGTARETTFPPRDMQPESDGLKRTHDQIAALREIADANPGMAFVGFGIEVEKKINALYERTFPDSAEKLAAGRKVSMLGQAGVLNRSLAYAIAELMRLRNQAAHGAAVEPDAAEWLLDVGPDLLFELERAAARGDEARFPHIETP